jgi:teichuronic acid biosynthesis glycosyltransferase TuaG
LKVSVVIPVYNAGSFLVRTLDSIIYQSYPIDELIIINDNSTDNTCQIINDYINSLDKLNFHFERINNEINLGPGISRNKGIELAKNSIIAFCDADDIWDQNKIIDQIKFIDKYPLIGTSYTVYVENFEFKKVNLSGEFSYSDFLRNNYLATSSVMINTNLILKSDLKFQNRVHEDYLLWLQLLKKYNIKAYVLDQYLMIYNRNASSFSSGLFKKIRATYNVYFLITESVISSVFLTINKIFRSLKRYY